MFKKTAFIILLLLPVSFTYAGDPVSDYKPATGDETLDLNLKELNRLASADKKTFIEKLTGMYDVDISPERISALIDKDKLQPADIYLAMEFSQISNKTFDDVITEYKKNKSKGWSYIAKQVGVKPGTEELDNVNSRIGTFISGMKSGEAEAEVRHIINEMTDIFNTTSDKLEKAATAREAANILLTFSADIKAIKEKADAFDRAHPEFKDINDNDFPEETEALGRATQRFVIAMEQVQLKFNGDKDFDDAINMLSSALQ